MCCLQLTFENLELSETVQSLKDSGNKKKEEEVKINYYY